MAVELKAGTETQAETRPLRVMVVDDSAVIRGMVSRWLAAEAGIEVVATAANGLLAVRAAAGADPDVIVLDVEMPEMDGLTALPALLKEVRHARILMSSSLTRAGGEVTMKALTLGAADCLAKPSSTREANALDEFKRDLITKVRALGENVRRRRAPARPSTALSALPRRAASAQAAPIRLRPAGTTRPQVVAIGSSTGGPQALSALLGTVARRIDLPILITQHMPPTFTAIMAEHLAKASGVATAEAVDGDVIQPRRIYVAPGNYHMTVERQGVQRVLRLNQEPPVNFCRPSVDPMMSSAAAAYGGAILAVMLTGMGQDGLVGARAIVEAGGTLIAQDEASSVVWGMPGAVATAGLCSAVLPLGEIGAAIERHLTGASLVGGRA